MMDANKNGLVAICEEMEVAIYAGSQFFEEADFSAKELYAIGNRDGSH